VQLSGSLPDHQYRAVEALEPMRDQVVIATEFGWDIQDGRSVGLNSRPEDANRRWD
jgi:aryl-alcohol dehydrogenase-like predicted oxidoreductase